MGGLTAQSVAQAQVVRLSGDARRGLSDVALQHIGVQMGPGGVALAERVVPLDPTPLAKPLALQASLVDASQPFQLAGPVESSRDLECLTAAVYYEARGETPAGQAAVAQVVLNRVRHPAFPKTVCGVVYQGAGTGGCQFSFACNGAMHRGRETGAWDRARQVAARALSGYVMDQVGRATHFHVASLGGVWGGRMVRVAQVGQHIFYSFSGRRSILASGVSAPSVELSDAVAASPPADGGDAHVASAAANTTDAVATAPDTVKPAASAASAALPVAPASTVLAATPS
ncbi:MAG: cell wall hydrolase [Caulobacterales bacterium]